MLDENLIASKFFIQHFQAHPKQFSCWIGLLLVSSNTSFLWRHFEMSLNSNKEDSDHLSTLQEQNGEEYEDPAEEVEDSGKRKGKQTKESIQRKQKKRKVGENYPLSPHTSAWLSIIRVYKL